ncbi:MAG: 7-cyano-7-deazaguanine synthase QueC, partial [Planctomycetota bacterium]
MSAHVARPAVVLLSGGLDSATVLALANDRGFRCHALTVAYGQRHEVELKAARAVAQHLGVAEHVEMVLDLRAFGGSALTDDAIAVPKRTGVASAASASSAESKIPVTYVPARNTIFLSLALAFAETRNARDIFIGVNAVDYSGYPDCRPGFVAAFEQLANVATKAGVETVIESGQQPIRVHAPLIHMTKAEIIQQGTGLGVEYALTRSCYDPEPATGAACGHCDSCILRRQGF